MGKKNKNEIKTAQKQGKKSKVLFNFLNVKFDNLDQRTVKNHIFLLILASIATKFIVIFVTTSIFHSFIDYFDIGTYFNHMFPLLSGQIPYVNYQVEYPILSFIPLVLAFIPAVLTQNGAAFIFSFQILMALCDILIVLCIYIIGLKIWNETTAFCAGLIYATAFSTAYFVLTKSDAFPTCILMVAILFTVYGMNTRGYIFGTLGFFTKIFPAIALPFMILNNAKSTSVKQELVSAGKIFLLLWVVLLLPFIIINPDVIRTYLFATGGTIGVYVNTVTYTLYAYLHDVFHMGITPAAISIIMYVLMGITFIFLVYIACVASEKDPKTLLKLVLCAIFCSVFFTKFHSPQYIVWFTPFLALLVADDLIKIGLFYLAQIFAYIEFPLMFGGYYTNLEYTNPIGSSGWYLTLLFFTLQYFVLMTLIYFTVRPQEGIITRLQEYYSISFRKQRY